MAKLLYAMLASLDGYVADATGNFDWAAPSEEVHEFVNDLERPVGTHIYGRRMYETMVVWETMATEEEPPCIGDFAAIWKSAEKVVYSRTLNEPASERTRIEPDFDPGAIRRMKEAAGHDISIGGPELAGQALKAGLVDECQLFLVPAIVGGGKPVFPAGLRTDLELTDQRRFDDGTVFLRYAVRESD